MREPAVSAPPRLTTLLRIALPALSPTGRAAIDALGGVNGAVRSANVLAAAVGLRDRHQLARVLRSEGLPPLQELSGWARVLYWLHQAESTRASLLQLMGSDPVAAGAAYRLVRSVTGEPWSVIRAEGLGVALVRLSMRCERVQRGIKPARRERQQTAEHV